MYEKQAKTHKEEDIQRFEMFISKLQGVQKQAEYQCMSLCPSHGDANCSLWTTLKENGRIYIKCHAGCKAIDVTEAMGFQGLGVLYGKPQIVATYGFITEEGELLYQEVKYDKETSLSRFAVRILNPKYKEKLDEDGRIISSSGGDKWDYKAPKDNEGGANGRGMGLRILFNLHDVVLSRKSEDDGGVGRRDGNIVFMCEGAKDAETLRKLGLAATAALINDWTKTDTSPLDCRKVIILVDYDEDGTNGKNAGEEKALIAAHNRYGKSTSVKLLRLPGLKEIGNHSDVTDWLSVGGLGVGCGANTRDKLLSLALNDDLPEWQPCESIKARIENNEMTGLMFEHSFPVPISDVWLSTYHSLTDGLLILYSNDWLKGCIKTLTYNPIMSGKLRGTIQKLLTFSSDPKLKGPNDAFHATTRDSEEVLNTCSCREEILIDVNRHTTMPIFRSSFMPEHERDWDNRDIVIMKSCNFHVPSRQTFPRNMQSCIARHALPFDYDPDAKCPEFEESLRIQWGSDQESIDLFLQYIFYCMISAPGRYKSILSLIGAPNTGKSKYLQLIAEFIGTKSYEAISLSKLGNQFELHRAKYTKVLICDDENVTKKDLTDGTLTENLLSISAGQPIRVEKKGGDIETWVIPAQIIIAGNKVLRMHANSSGLAERLKFLVFNHVYVRGSDMVINILDTWIAELPGIMNLVLDAGEKLTKNDGFIEPMSSVEEREKFETGANAVLLFVREYLDQNEPGDLAPWVIRIEDAKVDYTEYCEKFEVRKKLSVQEFNAAMEAIPGVSKKTVNTTKPDGSPTTVRCWVGVRKKGTDGTLNDRRASSNAGNEF